MWEKFYPFPLLRNYRTSKILDKLFQSFLDADAYLVKQDEFWTTIRCELGDLRFWTANQMYAYAKEGVFTAFDHRYEWKELALSRYMAQRVYARYPLPEVDKRRRSEQVITKAVKDLGCQ